MIISHCAMFAPNRCGLYEAARDMAKADVLAGHTVYFIDTGVIKPDGQKEPITQGQIDERSSFKIVTVHPDLINESDIIMMHSGLDDLWLVKNQAPIIWVAHGKPLDCFRPEQDEKKSSYSLYGNLSKWKRVKKMLYFWPEFRPYWSPVFPEEKHCIFDYPVIDQDRFCMQGKTHTLENTGKINVLICDSVRADIDLFETAIAAIEVAKAFPGIFKFHFYGFEYTKLDCWNSVLNELKRVEGLGDVKPRYTEMQEVYRAVDLVLSPNRINNRVVAESLCCGTPVMQEIGGNGIADYFCNISNTKDVIEAFNLFLNDFNNGINKKSIVERSKVFNLDQYSKKINKIYEEVSKNGC